MSRNLDTYDGLLEQAVLALYLQWPFLPRRATLPALEQLRRNLAGELQAMVAPPDQARFQSAARDFAGAALALPGVRAIAGADLTKLVATAETRPGVRTAVLISNAGVTPERVRELAAMLEVARPARLCDRAQVLSRQCRSRRRGTTFARRWRPCSIGCRPRHAPKSRPSTATCRPRWPTPPALT